MSSKTLNKKNLKSSIDTSKPKRGRPSKSKSSSKSKSTSKSPTRTLSKSRSKSPEKKPKTKKKTEKSKSESRSKSPEKKKPKTKKTEKSKSRSRSRSSSTEKKPKAKKTTKGESKKRTPNDKTLKARKLKELKSQMKDVSPGLMYFQISLDENKDTGKFSFVDSNSNKLPSKKKLSGAMKFWEKNDDNKNVVYYPRFHIAGRPENIVKALKKSDIPHGMTPEQLKKDIKENAFSYNNVKNEDSDMRKSFNTMVKNFALNDTKKKKATVKKKKSMTSPDLKRVNSVGKALTKKKTVSYVEGGKKRGRKATTTASKSKVIDDFESFVKSKDFKDLDHALDVSKLTKEGRGAKLVTKPKNGSTKTKYYDEKNNIVSTNLKSYNTAISMIYADKPSSSKYTEKARKAFDAMKSKSGSKSKSRSKSKSKSSSKDEESNNLVSPLSSKFSFNSNSNKTMGTGIPTTFSFGRPSSSKKITTSMSPDM